MYMDINKFRQRNQLLSQQLEQIAQNEIAALKLQIRRDFDPAARDLLAAQERLLNATERMLDAASLGTQAGTAFKTTMTA